jgi:hypothetical protein
LPRTQLIKSSLLQPLSVGVSTSGTLHWNNHADASAKPLALWVRSVSKTSARMVHVSVDFNHNARFAIDDAVVNSDGLHVDALAR